MAVVIGDRPFGLAAGTFTISLAASHSDFFIRDRLVLFAEQRLGRGAHYGAWIDVPAEVRGDPAVLESLTTLVLGRLARWTRPDPNPFPVFDLFPRASRLLRWVRRG